MASVLTFAPKEHCNVLHKNKQLLWNSFKPQNFEDIKDSGPNSFYFFPHKETKITFECFNNSTLAPSSSSNLVHIVVHSPVVVPLVSFSQQGLTVSMANRYAPLVLPANLDDLPQGYAQR